MTLSIFAGLNGVKPNERIGFAFYIMG